MASPTWLLSVLAALILGRSRGQLPGLRIVDAGEDGVFLGNNFLELGFARTDLGDHDRPGYMTTRRQPASFFGRVDNEFTRGDAGAIGLVYAPQSFANSEGNRIDFVSGDDNIEVFRFGASLQDLRPSAESSAVRLEDLFPETMTLSDVSRDPAEEVVLRLDGTTRDGAVHLRQDVSLRINDTFFKTEVTVWHTLPEEDWRVSDVRYMRSMDPENTHDLGGFIRTDNRVNRHRQNGGNDPITVISAATERCDAFCALNGATVAMLYVTEDTRGIVDTGHNNGVEPPLRPWQFQDTVRGATNEFDTFVAMGFRDRAVLPPNEVLHFTFYTVVGLGAVEGLIDNVVPLALALPRPSAMPTPGPTRNPTVAVPTPAPTFGPTLLPSLEASAAPSEEPTRFHSDVPSRTPTAAPSVHPTREPSRDPSPAPTRSPTGQPTDVISRGPSAEPSEEASARPSAQPSRSPSEPLPSPEPSIEPSQTRSSSPSVFGSRAPSPVLSEEPSRAPSMAPSRFPTATASPPPSLMPSLPESTAPSLVASGAPSLMPSLFASERPSARDLVMLSGAIFTRDAAFLLLEFENPVAQPEGIPQDATSFSCDLLFHIDNSAGEVCALTTNTSIAMDMLRDPPSRIQPGDTVNLKEGVLRPLDCGDAVECPLNAQESFVNVQVPWDAVVPQALVSFSPVTRPCDSAVVLDASASYGGAGRPLDYDFRFEFDDISDTIAADIETELLHRPNASVVLLPMQSLRVGTEYRFRLTVTNFLGQSSTHGPFAFQTASDASPVARVRGPVRQEIHVDSLYSVAVDLEPACGPDSGEAAVASPQHMLHKPGPGRHLQASNASGSWSIFEVLADERVASGIANAGSVDRALVIPSYALAPNATYILEYTTVVNGQALLASKAVTTRQRPLQPLVRGCNQTAAPSAASSPDAGVHRIRYDEAFDPNVGPATSAAARAAVSVVVEVRVAPSPQATPPGCTATAHSVLLGGGDGADARSVGLNTTAAAGCDVMVHLRFNGSSGLETERSCLVRVLAHANPHLAVMTPADVIPEAVNLNSSFAVAATARWAADRSMEASWMLSRGAFRDGASLADAAFPPVDYAFPARPVADSGGAAFSLRPLDLVLRRGVFQEGGVYTLTLMAALGADASDGAATSPAEASVYFVVNAAPRYGAFGISPPEGGFEDPFTLAATGWSDLPEHFPLQYLFRARASASDPGQLLNPSMLTATVVAARLPPGATASHEVTVFLEVADAFGAAAAVSGTAMVLRGNGSTALDSAHRSLRELEAAAADVDVDETYQRFGIVAALMAVALMDDATATEDARALQLETFGSCLDYFRQQRLGEVTPELLDTQTALLATLSRAGGDLDPVDEAFAANMSAHVLEGWDLLVNSTATILGPRPLLSAAGASELLRTLSRVVDLDGREALPGVLRRVDTMLQLRAAEQRRGGAAEVLTSTNLATAASVGAFATETETLVIDGDGDPTLRGAIEIAPRAMAETLGLDPLGSFVLHLVALREAALGNVTTDGRALLGAGLNTSDAVVAAGAYRASLRTIDGTPLPDGPALASAAPFTLTMGLRGDIDALLEEQCDTLKRPEGASCAPAFVCVRVDAPAGEVTAEEGCIATPAPADAPRTLECRCNFAFVARRRLQDDAGEVFADLSAMVATSFVFATPKHPDGWRVMWLVVIAIYAFFAVYSCVAHHLDTHDAAVGPGFESAARSLRRWFTKAGVGSSVRAKLYAHGVRSMKDVDIYRMMTPAELYSVTSRLGLNEAERAAFEAAILRTRTPKSRMKDLMSSASGSPTLAGRGPGRPSTLDEYIATTKANVGTEPGLDLANTRRTFRRLTGNWSAWSDEDSGQSSLARVRMGRQRSEEDYAPLVKTTAARGGADDELWFALKLAHGLDALLMHWEPTLSRRLWAAARDAHDYVDGLDLRAGDTPTRFVRVLRLAALVSATLVLQAVVYWVLFPQDRHYCDDFVTEEACEADASPIRPDQNRCAFDATDGCQPVVPALEADTVILAAATALILAVPVHLLIRHLVSAYVSDAPYPRDGDASLGVTYSMKRDFLRSVERKQAAELANAELNFLLANPACLPWFYRAMVQGCCGETALRWSLTRRVRAAAMEATRLEAELEPQQRLLELKLQAGHISADDYLSLVRHRKVALVKVAIRDALPILRRRVFRKYANLAGPRNPVPPWQRRLVLGGLVMFIALSFGFLVFFGVWSSDAVSRAWLVSIAIAEISSALLLMPLRILLLGVVLPALVRHDVTIDKALDHTPHYSAAAILARQRPDLVPGLGQILDDRHDRRIREWRRAQSFAQTRRDDLGYSNVASEAPTPNGGILSWPVSAVRDGHEVGLARVLDAFAAWDESSIETSFQRRGSRAPPESKERDVLLEGGRRRSYRGALSGDEKSMVQEEEKLPLTEEKEGRPFWSEEEKLFDGADDEPGSQAQRRVSTQRDLARVLRLSNQGLALGALGVESYRRSESGGSGGLRRPSGGDDATGSVDDTVVPERRSTAGETEGLTDEAGNSRRPTNDGRGPEGASRAPRFAIGAISDKLEGIASWRSANRVLVEPPAATPGGGHPTASGTRAGPPPFRFGRRHSAEPTGRAQERSIAGNSGRAGPPPFRFGRRHSAEPAGRAQEQHERFIAENIDPIITPQKPPGTPRGARRSEEAKAPEQGHRRRLSDSALQVKAAWSSWTSRSSDTHAEPHATQAARCASPGFAYVNPAWDGSGVGGKDRMPELDHRGCCLDLVTRLLLGVFAVFLLLPEPLQDVLLDEALPVCFAVIVLVDLGLPIAEELLRMALQGLMLAAALWLFALFVMLVQQSISATLEELRRERRGRLPRVFGHG